MSYMSFNLVLRLVGYDLTRHPRCSLRTTDHQLRFLVGNKWRNYCSIRNVSSADGSNDALKTPEIEKLSTFKKEKMDVFQKTHVVTSIAKPESIVHDTVYTREYVTANDSLVMELLTGIRAGSRSALARAITLVESVNPRKRSQAQALLREVLEDIRNRQKHSLYRVTSFRIGMNSSDNK